MVSLNQQHQSGSQSLLTEPCKLPDKTENSVSVQIEPGEDAIACVLQNTRMSIYDNKASDEFSERKL